MTSWAKPGVKCVCVKPKPSWAPSNAIYPVVGQVYTIQAVKPVGYGGLTAPCLMLEEIDNTHIGQEPYEPGFNLKGFRPLTNKTQEQDIELFVHHLAGKKIGALA